MREDGVFGDDVLRVLRRRAWLIVALVCVGAGSAAVLAGTSERRFESTARVLLRPGDPVEQLSSSEGSASRTSDEADRIVDTQIEIVESRRVAEGAAEALRSEGFRYSTGAVLDHTAASQSGPTDIVDVIGRADTADEAAALSNAVARAYIQDRRRSAVGGLEEVRGQIDESLDDLSISIDRLDAVIATDPPDAVARQRSRDALAAQYQSLSERRQELTIDIGLKRGEAELITEPTEPAEESGSPLARTVGIGAAIGLLMGVGLALLWDQLDDRVRGADDIEPLVDGPLVPELSLAEISALLASPEDERRLTTGIRALRNAVWLVDAPGGGRRVLVAGPEGPATSMLATGLAVSCAQAGQDVVLVAPSTTPPDVHRLLGLTLRTGLSELLADSRRPAAVPASGQPAGQHEAPRVPGAATAFAERSGIPGLRVLATGTRGNLASLFLSDQFIAVSHELASAFDVVVIDGTLLVPGGEVAPREDAVDVVVVHATVGDTSRETVRRTARILHAAGSRVCGVLIKRSGRRLPGLR
jgi:capsular polysaccharide biosynthesis protein/Mrp family chromosome partitioning ATPase